MFTTQEIKKMILRVANKGMGIGKACELWDEICFRNLNDDKALLNELYIFKFITHGQFIKMIDSVYA
jgi:hypothetical protein